MYSIVCLYTEEKLASPLRLLKSLFEHLGVTEVRYLEIYDKPMSALGDIEEFVEQTKYALINKQDLHPAVALRLLQETEGVTALLGVENDKWGGPIEKQMREANPPIPNDYYFVPWDISFVVGPTELQDLLCEKVIGHPRLVINLSGDHCPSEPDEFLRRLRELPRFKSLEAFLKETTGITFLVSLVIT